MSNISMDPEVVLGCLKYRDLRYLLNDNKGNYSTEELKFHADDSIKFDVVEKMKQYCINNNYDIITIDGVRITFDDSWALVRCSNTGPNITARFEAISEERLESIQKEFTDKLNEFLNEV